MKKRGLICLIFFVITTSLGQKAEAAMELFRDSVTGIIGSMEEEVEILRSKMNMEEVKKVASYTFYKGTLDGKQVVLVRSGIGKVNSAVNRTDFYMFLQNRTAYYKKVSLFLISFGTLTLR